MKTLIEARNTLAAAHYYLGLARGQFCEAIDAPDASPPGEPMNDREKQTLDVMQNAEQAALDAAEELLEVLGFDAECEDCVRDLSLPNCQTPQAPSSQSN